MSTVPFSYTLQPGQGVDTQIVRLSGPLTLNSMFEFQTALRAMTPHVLIVDLTDSPYMDSAGLGVIMNQHVAAQKNERKFLVAAANERILALMETTRVNSVLAIFPTVADAEASVQ